MNHYPLYLTLHNLRKRNANIYPLVYKYNSDNNNVRKEDFDGFDNSEENVNVSTINNTKRIDNKIKSKTNNKNIKKKNEDDIHSLTNNKEENSIKNEEGNNNEDDVFDDSSFNNESDTNEKINKTPSDSFEDDNNSIDKNNDDDSFDNNNITPFTSSTEDDFNDDNNKDNENNKSDDDGDDNKQQKYIDWINDYENNLKNSFYISNEGEKGENERKEFDRRKYQQFIKHFSNSKSTLYTDKYDFENASNEINLPIKIEDVDKYLYYIYCKVMNKNITGNISKYKLRYRDFKVYINKLIPECIMPPKRIVKYDEKEMIDFEKRLFDKFELSRESYSSPKYIKFKKHFNIKEYIKIRECIKGCLKCIGYSVKYTELIYDIIIDMYYHNKIDEKYFKEEFEKKCIEYNEIEKENRLLDRSKEIYIENKRKENLLYFIISFIFFANPGYIRYSKLKEIFKRNNIELYSNDYIYLLNFQSQFRCSLIHIIKTLPSLLLKSIEELEMKDNIDICEKYISYIKTFDLLKYISEKLLNKYPMLQINFEENDKKNFLEYLSGERSKDISFDPYKLIIKYYNLPDKYIVEEAIIYSYHWLYSKEGKWYIQMHERIKKCNEKKSKLEMFQKCKIQQIEKIKNEIHTEKSILKDLYYQYLLKYNGLKSEFPKKGIINEFSFEKYLSNDRNKRSEIDSNKEIQELIYEVDNDLLDEKLCLNDYLKDPYSYIKEEEKDKYLNEEIITKTKRKVKTNKEKENKEIKKHEYLKRKVYTGISKIPKLIKRKKKEKEKK